MRFDTLRADAAFGWRQLTRHKAVSAAAILSLGLAMGSYAAAFRLIDVLFLRPSPVADPQGLYVISRPGGGRGDGWAVSFPERTDLIDAAGDGPKTVSVQYLSGWTFQRPRPAAGAGTEHHAAGGGRDAARGIAFYPAFLPSSMTIRRLALTPVRV